MASPPPYQQLTPDALGATAKAPIQAWGTNLLRVLNLFQSVAAQCLNGALTIGQNIAGMRYPSSGYFKYTTGAKYTESAQFTPISFSWTAQQYKQPDEVRIGLVQRLDGTPQTLPVQPFWTYNQQSNTITIYFMTGLVDSTDYYFTFLVQ